MKTLYVLVLWAELLIDLGLLAVLVAPIVLARRPGLHRRVEFWLLRKAAAGPRELTISQTTPEGRVVHLQGSLGWSLVWALVHMRSPVTEDLETQSPEETSPE